MTYEIQSREKHEYNTDPQRRCYNGCHFSSEWRWGERRSLGSVSTPAEAEESLARWRSIPMGARVVEFRIVPPSTPLAP